MKMNLKKHDNFILANCHIRFSWSFSQRLIIYKTFCSSLINYGGGAFASWLTQQTKSCQDKWIELLNSVHLKALDFIYGTIHNPTILISMAALCLPKILLEHLKASLTCQLQKLPPYHPLLHLDIPYGTLLNRDYFAHLVMESPLLQRFSTDNESLPSNRKTSWKRFMITNRLDACLNTSGVLQHYIRPQSRSTSNGTDILFKASTRSSQSKIFAWRNNTAFRNKTCICQNSFNRRHARDCIPVIQLSDALAAAYNLFLSSPIPSDIQQELSLKHYKKDFCFTFLDFYLTQDVNLFLECFDLFSSSVT